MNEVKTTALTALAFGANRPETQTAGAFPGFKTEVDNNKRKFGLQSAGLKTFFALFFSGISTFTASAQKAVVSQVLSKHGIDVAILDPQSLQQPDDYAFDLKFTSTTTAKQTVTLAKFDPSNPPEERWTVVSVDGKTPTKAEINSFRKDHSKPPASSTQADDASYKVDKETSDYLVVSYKQDPASTPRDVAFMKDCRLYLTINLKTQKVERVQIINEKPLKIKVVNAEKFDLTIKYTWNDQAKRYFTASEDLNMLVKFLGQTTSVQTNSEYANYAKK